MNIGKMIKEFLIITIGTIIVGASVFFFMMPNHLAVGSISGLSIVLSNFIPLNVSTITLILNVSLLILGAILIGRDFGIKTVYTSILLPIVMGVLEIMFPENQSIMGDAFLDMIFYIFSVSIGLAILFNLNASSGGLDIIAKILNKFFHVELGKAMSLAGMCAALAAAFVYDIKTVAISVLGTYLFGLVLDHYIFGMNIKKRICIISKKEQEIEDYVLHTLHSGASIYEPMGAYDKEIHKELIVIVTKNEYNQLINFISQVDPNAFVTVYNVNEVFYRPKNVPAR